MFKFRNLLTDEHYLLFLLAVAVNYVLPLRAEH